MFRSFVPHVRTAVRCSTTTGTRAASSNATGRNVVLVDGCRTPFHMSGTVYNDLIAQDLGRYAMKGLVTRTAIDKDYPDYVLYGKVIQEVRTSNVARESALSAGISKSVPAHTVTMACISANQALSTGACMIKAGQADVVIAGGTETMSDVPIRFSKPIRQRLIKASRMKSPQQMLGLLKGLKLKDLAPEAPAIAEFSTGEVMGHSSDRLAARFGITRQAQDEYALSSHQKAAAAHDSGALTAEIVPVFGETRDNGIKGDSTIEKLSSLKAAFVRPHGTHTAANSSFLTDGASAALIMSEEKALADGFTPKSVLKDWIFVSQDPKEELLLGPAYAVSRLLARNNLTLNDIDVWELHEAFAGQVLANLAAMDSDSFTRDSIGLSQKVGEVPRDKLNLWGGSLSIGHPFGATGTRIVTTASNRLIAEDGELAVVAACAAGGLGHAMLVQRWKPAASSSSRSGGAKKGGAKGGAKKQ